MFQKKQYYVQFRAKKSEALEVHDLPQVTNNRETELEPHSWVSNWAQLLLSEVGDNRDLESLQAAQLQAISALQSNHGDLFLGQSTPTPTQLWVGLSQSGPDKQVYAYGSRRSPGYLYLI